ncbi:MAG TPA: DUF1059 domain-containing protein [Solirubrobacteraceae bacterium]|nr:DUF1059 domain-containing protein [Solirubrobacteraceae bacterium]
MDRKYIDCREMPSENGCDLVIAGSEGHVLDAAVTHAITAHKHENTPDLREQIRISLKDVEPGMVV